jgi:hypothetical protein
MTFPGLDELGRTYGELNKHYYFLIDDSNMINLGLLRAATIICLLGFDRHHNV